MADAHDPETECPELARIHALADGELSPREAAVARRHLVWCAQCRSELAFLMQLAVAVAKGVAELDELEASVVIAVIGRPS